MKKLNRIAFDRIRFNPLSFEIKEHTFYNYETGGETQRIEMSYFKMGRLMIKFAEVIELTETERRNGGRPDLTKKAYYNLLLEKRRITVKQSLR